MPWLKPCERKTECSLRRGGEKKKKERGRKDFRKQGEEKDMVGGEKGVVSVKDREVELNQSAKERKRGAGG